MNYFVKKIRLMNIFILSKDQKKCVQYMYDKHVVKILLEIVQMLCTTKRVLDGECGDFEGLYKIAHVNHPVTKWIRESEANYLWTTNLLEEMHNEWRYRFGHPDTKFHKSYLVYKLIKQPKFEKKELTEFPQAMPEIYKCKGDAVKAYRDYYRSPDKLKLMSWKNRERPDWFDKK